MGRATNRSVVVRAGLATLIVGVLVAGFWLVPGGASTAAKKKKTWSESDCATLQNIKVDPKKGAGSFGTAAKANSDAYNAAANKIQDGQLKSSLKKLASFYVDLGNVDNAKDAAILTAKGGKAYGKALKVFIKASIYCVTQITIPPVTVPSVTTPSASSSTTSTSSASSTSTSTSTSTSSPSTTTTTSATR